MPEIFTFAAVCGFVGLLYQQEIKHFFSDIYNYLLDSLTCSIIIDQKSSATCRTIYSINNELKSKYESISTKKIAEDGTPEPNYRLPGGRYVLEHDGISIHVDVGESTTTLWCYLIDPTCLRKHLNKIQKKYCTTKNIKVDDLNIRYSLDPDFLRKYLDIIYKKHNTTDNVIMSYLSEKNSWSLPTIRRPRKNIKMTSDMEKMYKDVYSFLMPGVEEDYERVGKPYRRGYLIYGPSGSGKTSMIEKIANEHSMAIYLVNFNSDGMTDSVLINLVANVPPRSVIVFDEMDKQYEAIKGNKNIHISTGGILTALDGIPRINHGNIIIIIANDITKFDPDFKTPLLRPGRIDVAFNFLTPL